ncbi:MAG: family 43 glycosylhydrolase [Pseudolysinimonas sp.]
MISTVRPPGDAPSGFPFIRERADPQFFRSAGQWHFLSTDDRDGDNEHSPHLIIRSSATVAGLASASDIELLRAGDVGLTGCFWAPEAHVIGGRLRIFFSPSVDGDEWTFVQSHIMTLRLDGDPAVPADWGDPIRVSLRNGRPLQTSGEGISLDMTLLRVRDDHYVIWSQRQVRPTVAPAELWIALIDPRSPERLVGDPSRILAPQLPWEGEVLEGPAALVEGGQVHLAYAAGAVGPDYVTGVATAPMDADLLDRSSWRRRPEPALDNSTVFGEFGPGHVSFTHIDDQLWMAYHAMTGRAAGPRHAGLRRVGFSTRGRLELSPPATRGES